MTESAGNLRAAHGAVVNPIWMHIGTKVRELREARGWGPEDLVTAVNEIAGEKALDVRQVSRMESGEQIGDIGYQYVPQALGITHSDMYEGLPMPEPRPEDPLDQATVDQLAMTIHSIPLKDLYRYINAAQEKARQMPEATPGARPM